jgi:hypothetical protein
LLSVRASCVYLHSSPLTWWAMHFDLPLAIFSGSDLWLALLFAE